jgi:opacity protein-like surface antigen
MKSIAAVMTLALAMAAGPVIADEDQGFYLGAGVGQFNLEVDDISDISGETFKSDDTSLKVFGGWRFNPFISAELAYIDFGGPEDTVNSTLGNANVDISISGFAPYLVGTLPIGIFEVFAKVGYYLYDADVTISAFGQSLSDDTCDEDLVYGAGVGVVLFKRLDARLEYEIIDVSDVDTSDAVWLTGAWRF